MRPEGSLAQQGLLLLLLSLQTKQQWKPGREDIPAFCPSREESSHAADLCQDTGLYHALTAKHHHLKYLPALGCQG